MIHQIDPDHLQRFFHAPKSPTFSVQAAAMFRRRLKSFIKQPQQIMLMLGPCLFCTIELIIFSTILKAMSKTYGSGPPVQPAPAYK